MGRWLLRIAIALVAIVFAVWGGLALHFAGPRPVALANGLAILWAVGSLAVLLFLRPFRRALLVYALGLVLLHAWWYSLEPRNDRDWIADVAHPPTAELDGDTLTIHDLRNFDYRSETDYTARWETRTYDLARLNGLDLFMSYWGSPSIAHTIMSWDFDDGQHLAISIETRKERGETYSAIAGFFKQYELYYVAADERDVVRLRTNYRGEDVYLYPLRVEPAQARAVLLDYVKTMNELAAQAQFYDAATANCTTSIRTHVKHIGAAQPLDWRLFLNGYGDQMLYERGRIDNSRPFAEVRAAAAISERGKAAGQDPDYSARIRTPAP
jgi:hypothetical protein